MNSLLTIGCWFSLNFSMSPWSKNSSATIFAALCWTSQGLAIALTSQAVISIPHSTKEGMIVLFCSNAIYHSAISLAQPPRVLNFIPVQNCDNEALANFVRFHSSCNPSHLDNQLSSEYNWDIFYVLTI